MTDPTIVRPFSSCFYFLLRVNECVCLCWCSSCHSTLVVTASTTMSTDRFEAIRFPTELPGRKRSSRATRSSSETFGAKDSPLCRSIWIWTLRENVWLLSGARHGGRRWRWRWRGVGIGDNQICHQISLSQKVSLSLCSSGFWGFEPFRFSIGNGFIHGTYGLNIHWAYCCLLMTFNHLEAFGGGGETVITAECLWQVSNKCTHDEEEETSLGLCVCVWIPLKRKWETGEVHCTGEGWRRRRRVGGCLCSCRPTFPAGKFFRSEIIHHARIAPFVRKGLIFSLPPPPSTILDGRAGWAILSQPFF